MINMVLLGAFWMGVWAVIKWILIIIGGVMIGSALYDMFDNRGHIVAGGDWALLIIGSLLIFFFGCISYWGLFQWILFLFFGIMAIVTGLERWKRSSAHLIFAIATIAFSLYFLLRYLFVPYWDTFRWVALFIAAVGVAIGVWCLVRPFFRKMAVERRRKLTIEFRDAVSGLPLSDYSIFDMKSEQNARKILRTIRKLELQLSNSKVGSREHWAIKKKLYEAKMDAFYLVSLRGESQKNLDLYQPFESLHSKAVEQNDYNVLRVDPEQRLILEGKPTSSMKSIANWQSQLKNDRTRNYQSELEKIQNMDTKGIFGFTANYKLSSQTRAYEDLLNTALDETKELYDANIALNNELISIRLTAYRNIYLGVELLNYLRDNAGGKKLATEKGVLSMHAVPEIRFNVDVKTITMNYDRVCDRAAEGFNVAIRSLNSLGYNPGRGASIAIGGLAAIGAGIEEWANKVSANREQQAQLVSLIDKAIPTIQKGQAGLLRTIEVMKSIVNANNGFTGIYAPLYEKVFLGKGGAITQEDIQALTRATSEFQKISTTRL